MTGLFWDEQAKFVTSAPPPPSDWVLPSVLPDLRNVKRIAVDVETNDPGLRAGRGIGVKLGGFICGLAVGTDDGRRWYLPFAHANGNNLPKQMVLKWAQDQLNSFTGEVVGAHITYDLDYLAEVGVTFKRAKGFKDVLMADALIDETHLSYSLEAVSQRWLQVGKDEALLDQAARYYGVKKKEGLWELPPQYVGPYAEMDVELPLRLLDRMEKRIHELKLNHVWELESELIPLLLAMQRHGVRVSEKNVEHAEEVLAARYQEALDTIQNITGQTPDIWAAESLGPLLEQAGHTLPRTKKTNAYSVTKSWLQERAGDPLIDAILLARSGDKVGGTFLKGHIRGHLANTGRVYPEFRQTRSEDGGTRSGRFSSTFHNLPSPDRDPLVGQVVRACFVPEDGNVWERFDYSQIEYRFLAHFAVGTGAEEARKAYKEDPTTDFHQMTAEMSGETNRTKVKGTNFGTVYGAGGATIARTLGVPESEAREFLNTYHTALPFVKATGRAAQLEASRTGFVKTVLGRRSNFTAWEPRNKAGPPLPEESARRRYGENIQRAFTHRSLNRKLQGSAADLMKVAMRDIWRSGVCDVLGPPLLTVHDELDFDRPPTDAGEEAAREAQNIMETCMELRVPIMVKRESGPDWGHVK